MVLLGIRTAPKEDLGCSSAELVYVSPLTVPGDFIANQSHQEDHGFQLQHLRDHVQSLAPVPTSQHGAVHSLVPADLQLAKFVFICRDAHHTPTAHPCKDPIKALSSSSRVDPRLSRSILGGGKTTIITVDRLKQSHLDGNSPVISGTSTYLGQASSYQL